MRCVALCGRSIDRMVELSTMLAELTAPVNSRIKVSTRLCSISRTYEKCLSSQGNAVAKNWVLIVKFQRPDHVHEGPARYAQTKSS